MAIVNVVFQEDELTNRVINDFGLIYSPICNQLYSDNANYNSVNTAYVQLSNSIIHVYKNLMELIPNVLVYKEKFDNGILDTENYEVVTYTSENEEYGKVLFAALCNKYKEVLTALLISASEIIQTNPTDTLVFPTDDSYGKSNPNCFGLCLEIFGEIRQFVRDIILSDVTVLDYIINVAPILADTYVTELIWKRYIKHCVKINHTIAVNNLVVGKLMAINDISRLPYLLDDVFDYIMKDKDNLELDESSILYYKMNSNLKEIVFEHRLGPYAQALFANDTQAILSTPVIEGMIDRNMFKFGYRSKFIPVNAPTGETFKNVKCEGLLAQFAS